MYKSLVKYSLSMLNKLLFLNKWERKDKLSVTIIAIYLRLHVSLQMCHCGMIGSFC